MTHQQSIQEQINLLELQNKDCKVVVFIHPTDFNSIKDLDKLSCEVVTTRHLKIGEISLKLYPKTWINPMHIVEKKKPSFIQKFILWVKQKLSIQ